MHANHYIQRQTIMHSVVKFASEKKQHAFNIVSVLPNRFANIKLHSSVVYVFFIEESVSHSVSRSDVLFYSNDQASKSY